MEIFVTIIFALFLVVIAAEDFKTLMIYDKKIIPMAVVGIFFDLIGWLVPIEEAIVNFVLGFLLMFLIFKISRGGMGGGDVKFSAVLGLWLGEKIFSAILAAAILASIFALLLLLKSHDWKKQIPFGPFLSAGAFLIHVLDLSK